jgi:BirA family transcriptional regulator, biotin operon repressor / biotin---[acetyl-CoA-carboxylase] ligase
VLLDEDPRVRQLLASSPTWHALVHRAEVSSTQDVALELLRDGAPPGLVVVADAQRSGRGRLGRSWRDSVQGRSGPANLAVTATVAPPSRGVGLVPLVAGVAVAEAYGMAGGRPRLKWPNDVLLDGRKAAGILVERHTTDAGGVLLIGCGLNLDWRGVDRDVDATTWTSLAESIDGDVDRAQVLVSLLGQLGAGLGKLERDPASVLREYRPRCATLGEPVRVERPGRAPLHGRAVDLDVDGRLVVVTDAGREVIDVGDVVHVRAADAGST